MAEQQIDPYKLNEVLEQILDGIHFLQDRHSSASPEFQILMTNYLTKANDCERNQARLEESLERLEIKDQELKEIQAEKKDFQTRLSNFEKDYDSLRKDTEREITTLKDTLHKVKKESEESESNLKKKIADEIKDSTINLQKQLHYADEQLNDLQGEKRKLENKLLEKSNECSILESELFELKTKIAQEQVSIREEILEATRRSSTIEQRYQGEREHFLTKIKELEAVNEELTNSVILKQRELEYKDALLSQTYKHNAPRVASPQINAPLKSNQNQANYNQVHDFNANRAANSFPQEPRNYYQDDTEYDDLEFRRVQQEIEQTKYKEEPKTASSFVGGIWSKLSG